MPSLRTIELDWAGRTPPEDQPQFEISDFFAWMFGIGAFDCAVIAAQRRRFHADETLRVVSTLADAHAQRRTLERLAQAGFEVVVAVKVDLDELIGFFRRFGYHVEGEGALGDGGEHDPLVPASNGEALTQAIEAAASLSHHPLCLFAHDGDPVYLIR